jgi:hypothetical protein
MHTKEELEREKLRHEVNNLRYGWIQRASALAGLSTIVITTLVTNVSEYLKVKKLENKEHQVSVALADSEKVLHQEGDSLKKIGIANLRKEIAFSESYNERRQAAVGQLKSKDEEIAYYRGQLDSITDMIVKSKAIKHDLMGIAIAPKPAPNNLADTITANIADVSK